MVSGLSQWFSHPADRPLPPTIGALTRQHTLLAAAFQSQSDIGWSSLLRGHLSTHWEAVFEATYTPAKKKKHPTPATLAKLSRAWSHRSNLHLWAFSKTIWAARNAVVHGKTDLTLSKDILQLHQSVTNHYTKYQADPHYVLSHHTHLFNRQLNTMLTYCRNTLSCWICSVEEAVQTRAHRSTKTNRTIKHYFQVSAA
jgi:hypothetical protein